MKRTVLVGVMALVVLAACSAKKPPPAGSDDEDRQPAAPASSQPAKPVEPPPPNPAVQAEGMSQLIDPAPQCQTYRDQLQAASKGPPGAATSDAMSKVVKAAFAAGCGHKMSTQ